MRWILRIACTLLLLAALAVLVRVVPAHLQIRQVHPRLPTVTELRTLLAVPGGPDSLRYVVTSSQQLAHGTLGHDVFFAGWPDGTLFEVDAGMDGPAALDFGKLLQRISGAGEVTPGASVPELIGNGVRNVRGLGLTHLHIDHTQGLLALCAAGPGHGARVYRSQAQATLRDPNTKEGAAIVEASCFEKVLVGREGLLPLPGFPGAALIPLGGHTACSTMFAFAVNGHLWLLAGDITNSRQSLLANTGKGFFYSGLIVPEDTARTEELRRYLAALDAEDDITVVVSHDLEALRTSGLPEWRNAH